jgi:hypothetical protein
VPGLFVGLLKRIDEGKKEGREGGRQGVSNTDGGIGNAHSRRLTVSDSFTFSSLSLPLPLHLTPLPLLPPLLLSLSPPPGMDGLGKKNTFFAAGMGGYSLGLLLTFSANILMHRGQPALLYIVPSLIAAALGTAAVTGRWEEVWGFNSEEAEEGVEGA